MLGVGAFRFAEGRRAPKNMREICSTHKGVYTGLGAGPIHLFRSSTLLLIVLWILWQALVRDVLVRAFFSENSVPGTKTAQEKLDTSEQPEAALTKMPRIFTDPGWETLNTSNHFLGVQGLISMVTSALRLFGSGPVVVDGIRFVTVIKEYLSFSSMLLSAWSRLRKAAHPRKARSTGPRRQPSQ